jgi:PEP-CTERM motif/Dockerin type I domain
VAGGTAGSLGTGPIANAATLQVDRSGLTVGHITGGGTTTVNATGASLTASSIRQNALNIGAGNTVTVATNGTSAGVSQLNSLSITGGAVPTGTLDITNNGLIVSGASGALAQKNLIAAQIASGANPSGALWTGPGITSSTAATQALTNPITAVGMFLNDAAQIGNGSGISGVPLLTNFPGAGGPALSSTDVVVKYTYFGDANLDGQVDSTDYFLIDNAFSLNLVNGGWVNGDFDYDGDVDSTDYFLIDNAFANQGSPLTGGLSLQAASSLSVQAIPEPGSLALLAAGVCGAGVLWRRRRRQAPQADSSLQGER